MDKTVEEIEKMSQEELLELEDQLEAGESPEADSDSTPEPPDEVAESKEPEADEGSDDDQPAAAGGEDDGADPKPKEKEPEPSSDDDDLKKHVSPPSQWAKHRHEQKALKAEAEALRAKADKADTLEQELTQLRGEMDWLKQAVAGRGVDIPAKPSDVITDERIANIREEHGDDMADIVAALRAQANMNHETAAPAAPKEEEPPAAPAAPTPPAQQGPDPAIVAAIEANDELTWWREQSPKLWQRAVDKDDKLREDPVYLALSYEDRFKRVVDEVKKDVLQAGSTAKKDEDSPPTSLSGSGGVAPAPIENDALAKMEAIQDPEKQLQFYNSLPEDVRDQIDQALNI